MKTKNIFLIALLFLGFISCTKNDTMTYEDENFVCLTDWEVRETGEFLKTSFTFLFEDASLTQKVLEIPVMAIGKMINDDRVFALQVVDSLTTAVEGTHFSINAADQIVPANSTGGSIKVNLMKTADMDDTEYQLGLELVSNDAFTAGISTVVVIKFSNFFSQPDWWLTPTYGGSYNLGPFTQIKAILWMQYRGITDGSDPLIDYKQFSSYSGTYSYYPEVEVLGLINGFKYWLETDAGGPYYDENGDLVSETFNY